MRLLICAGGTGGGVYPALAVLQAMGNEASSILWVGGEGGMEADLVKRNNVPFATIPAAGVHGVGLRTLPGNLIKLALGSLAARRIIKQFKPDVLLFTGGYVAVPMAVAGRSIPSLLYVPDIEPGLALKFLSRNASSVALTAPGTKAYLPSQAHTLVTGYPTRPELGHWTREKALEKLDLNSNLPTLLVFGGSQGARSINRSLTPHLEALLAELQIVHLTGQLEFAEIRSVRETLHAELAGRYHIYPYLHEEMGAAFAAADLAISRAGASTLGELPLFGLPAILVPYPYAWRYQKVNADYLVNAGAAIMVEDAHLVEQLPGIVLSLVNAPDQLGAMRKAMSALAHPDAAHKLALEVSRLASQKGQARS